MSRVWKRAPFEMRCGSCNRPIAFSRPVQEIHFDFAPLKPRTHVPVRCEWCADGPVPDDLPDVVNRTTPIAPTVLLRTRPGMLPLDFKAAASNDRQPGEDG